MTYSRKFKGMIFLVICGVLLTINPNDVSAQREAKNAIYVSLLGTGLIYSVNYDRMLSDKVGFRLGFSTISVTSTEPGDDDNVSLKTFPLTLNYLMGSGKHQLELGAGVVIVSVSGDIDEGAFEGSGVAGTGTFGYRFQPQDGGFVFRLVLTPLFGSGGFAPWGGLSLGYSF